MKLSYKVLCLTFIGLQASGFYNCYSQNSVTEEQVIEQVNELSKQAAENRANLDHYFEPNFSIHLKQRDLLSSIKGQTLFKLKYYHHLAHEYAVQKLYRQSVKNGRDFLDLYNRERGNLPIDQIEIFDRRKSFNLGQLSLSYSKLNLLDSAEIYHKRNLKWTQRLDRLTHASAINNYGIFLF
ncbi:MAG: hypothetical protein R3213_13315, partial [Flavobacteriaceae bacterium]|nr:hypothetical protein [Flavobacteriaceae bacterium]